MMNHARAFILYPMAEGILRRDIRSKLSALRELQSQSLETRRELQKQQLVKIVAHAGAHVPYYRDLFRSIGFSPERVEASTDYLQEIPPLTKDILREQGERMLDERLKPSDLKQRQTNGSTGLCTTIWYDQDSLDLTAAVNLLASEFSDCDLTKTKVHLGSEFFDSPNAKEALVEKFRAWSLNRVNMRTHSFDKANLDKLLNDLGRAKAHAVYGHPSTIYLLALHARGLGRDVRGLFKVFQSTGESLEAAKLKVIEESFSCRVYNRYGNAEFGAIAQSRGTFDELEMIEGIVYPESHSLGNGLEEIVLTGLTNKAMPLIRYRTGDVGEIITRDGRQHIKQLTGRVHDVVELNGQPYPTHYIRHILDRLGGTDEFQIVQRPASGVTTLKIVPNQAFNRQQVETRLNELFGGALKVETVGFEGLVMQGWRDKFRYVVAR
jgi:phenylacetate-CoA ligase